MDVGISFLVYSRLQLCVFDLEAISNSASLTREIIYTTYFNQSISWSEHEWCDFYFPPRISALISAQYCIPIVGLIYWCIAFKVEQMRCNVWPLMWEERAIARRSCGAVIKNRKCHRCTEPTQAKLSLSTRTVICNYFFLLIPNDVDDETFISSKSIQVNEPVTNVKDNYPPKIHIRLFTTSNIIGPITTLFRWIVVQTFHISSLTRTRIRTRKR